jgi:hypothetical protein
MKKSFRTTLASAGKGEVGLIEIPFDVKTAFGAARPKVVATVKKVTWRTTVAVYGGKSYIGMRKEIFAESKAKIGETVGVALEPDTAPRTVRPPAALASALKKSKIARAGWDRMSFTHKKEWAEAIAEAKKPETRARRLAQALAALEAKGRASP